MAIGLPTTRGSQSSMAGLGGPTKYQTGQNAFAGVGGGTTPPKTGSVSPTSSSVGLTATPVAVGASPVSGQNYYNMMGAMTGTATGAPTPVTSSSSSSSSSLGGQLGSAISSLLGGVSGSTGASSTPAVSYNPGQFSVQAQENPQLAALIGEMGGIRQGLAQGSDMDAQLAMQRQRDVTSGMASEFAQDPASRGILGSGAAQQDLLKKIVNPGQQALGALNANLASDARSKQLAALGQQAGLVNQQDQLTQAQQQFGLQSWQAQQQAQQAAAQLAAMQQHQGLSNLSSVIGLIGQLGGLYSGF